MNAMLVDDEALRAPVKIIRELLQAEGILVEPNYEFLGNWPFAGFTPLTWPS